MQILYTQVCDFTGLCEISSLPYNYANVNYVRSYPFLIWLGSI